MKDKALIQEITLKLQCRRELYSEHTAQEIVDMVRESDTKLLKVISDDLKMRAGEDGVINISNFIWDHIKRRLAAPTASIDKS